MKTTILVDPFRCRLWSLHDRLEEHIDEDNCAREIESFQQHGQRVSVLGRPVCDDPDYDVEVICGGRRLFIARLLGMQLLVEMRDLTDKEAIISMHIENCLRKEVSPYERGLAYQRWLRSGSFKSQDEMAAALGVSASRVCRLLKLAKLPSVILAAFGTAVDIREGWGDKLTEVIEDPVRKEPVIRAARSIAASGAALSPREVYRQLLAAAAPTAPGGRKASAIPHDKVVEGVGGEPLFRIRQQQDAIALLLPVDRMSARTLDAIQRAVARILADSIADAIPVMAIRSLAECNRVSI